MRHQRLTLVAGIAALLLIAGCSGGHKKPSKPPSSTTSKSGSASHASSSTPAAPNPTWDGKDPQTSGCSAHAIDVPRSAVPVLMADNKTRYGTLALRFSPACNAVWARVINITRSGVDIAMHVVRGSNSEPFVTNRAVPGDNIYTPMLAVEKGECMYATATVGTGTQATTPCLTG